MVETVIDGRFELVDHNGVPVTERSYRGGWMLVFFGFTHCRMVCPRALGKLSDALDQIRDLTTQIAPLYITVDPKRDSPEVMRAFLADPIRASWDLREVKSRSTGRKPRSESSLVKAWTPMTRTDT
jgi:cytochrome oxidase Cu insertion factor (SCO1/SenC/PrrC family)